MKNKNNNGKCDLIFFPLSFDTILFPFYIVVSMKTLVNESVVLEKETIIDF